ncbi:MAG: hypothetical protein J0H59_00100, partial [Comamonadaceae bacterium]|nr:hypothetical protein [Comamonadaceae bacterium]
MNGRSIGNIFRNGVLGILFGMGVLPATTLAADWSFAGPLLLSPSTWAEAVVGTAYVQPLEVSGGTAPYQWSQSGLPAACQLQAGADSGAALVCQTLTISEKGTHSVRVSVVDARGTSLEERHSLVVSDTGLPPQIPEQALSPAVQKQAYEYFLTALHGVAPR